jgi:hypothetical protein
MKSRWEISTPRESNANVLRLVATYLCECKRLLLALLPDTLSAPTRRTLRVFAKVCGRLIIAVEKLAGEAR